MLSTADAYFNNYNFHAQNSELQMHLQDSKINIFNQMNLNVKPSPLLDAPVMKEESPNLLNHIPFGIASFWYAFFYVYLYFDNPSDPV